MRPLFHESRRESLAAPPAPIRAWDVRDEKVLAQARSAKARGQLTEALLIRTAQRGEARLAAALLAVAADVPLAAVDHAAALRSAKGMVSLVWKAGFSMQAATPLQVLLARLPPDEVARPDAAGGFPFATEELRWQVEFLSRR
jgi:hypothetical protein